MFTERPLRTVIKMLSWRVFGTLTTVVLVYIFTGKISLAISLGITEVFIKTLIYYFHERVWNRLGSGRVARKGFVLWFTGLPCSGKSTLADKTFQMLKRKGIPAEHLDGDKLREMFPGTGFSEEERNRHIKRAGRIASMLERNGVAVVASFISPYKSSRDFVRGLCEDFSEIHVSTPVEECIRRDVKGLYEKARTGQLKGLTGVDAPYERPESPELEINTAGVSIDEGMRRIEAYIRKRKRSNAKT